MPSTSLIRIKTEIKETLSIGLPIVVSQLGIVAMGVADTIQIGMIEGHSTVAVAAAGVVNSLVFTVGIIGIIALGVIAPMISKAEAEETADRVASLYRTAIRVAFILAAATVVISLSLILSLDLFRQDPEVTVWAKPYGWMMAISMLPLFLFLAVRQLSDGLGKTHLAMIITLSALVLNILLNWLFINGIWIFPRWYLFGTGVATFISRVAMTLGLWLLVRRDAQCAGYLRQKGSEVAALTRKVFVIGLPAGMQGFFEVAVFAAAVVIIGWYGKSDQAAHMIAISMCSVTYMMVTGIASAGGIRVGHFWGLKDKPGMLLSGKVALSMAGGFMLGCALLFLACKHWLVGLYTLDLTVTPVAIALLTIGAFFQISDGLQATALGVLRGIADVNVPTIITLFAYWIIGLPIGYYLGTYCGLRANGVWVGLTAGLTASAVLLCFRFYRITRKMQM